MPHRHLEHARRAADLVALLELKPVTEDDRADVVLFQVQRERGDGVLGFGGGNLEHLPRHGLRESVDASDAVLDFKDDYFFESRVAGRGLDFMSRMS